MLGYFVDSSAVGGAGLLLFVLGVVLVGVGAGLRALWRSFWEFLPP